MPGGPFSRSPSCASGAAPRSSGPTRRGSPQALTDLLVREVIPYRPPNLALDSPLVLLGEPLDTVGEIFRHVDCDRRRHAAGPVRGHTIWCSHLEAPLPCGQSPVRRSHARRARLAYRGDSTPACGAVQWPMPHAASPFTGSSGTRSGTGRDVTAQATAQARLVRLAELRHGERGVEQPAGHGASPAGHPAPGRSAAASPRSRRQLVDAIVARSTHSPSGSARLDSHSWVAPHLLAERPELERTLSPIASRTPSSTGTSRVSASSSFGCRAARARSRSAGPRAHPRGSAWRNGAVHGAHYTPAQVGKLRLEPLELRLRDLPSAAKISRSMMVKSSTGRPASNPHQHWDSPKISPGRVLRRFQGAVDSSGSAHPSRP